MRLKGSFGPAIVALAFFVLAYVLHLVVIGDDRPLLKEVLLAVYIFHLVFALAVIIVFGELSVSEKLKDQLGFIYLWAMAAKLVLFVIFFHGHLFSETTANTASQGNFLPPVFLGLVCEVTFLAKTLKAIK